MTYKTIAPNILEDEFGHQVRILGRTGILHSFAGREIQIDSEILAADFGFAIYGDWSRLISPGNGGPDLQDEEVVTAIDEIVKALSDIGEKVEIATRHKANPLAVSEDENATSITSPPVHTSAVGNRLMKRLLIAILVLLTALGVSAAINPLPRSWEEISAGGDALKVIASLGKPDAHRGDDTHFWLSSYAWLTYPIFFRYLTITDTECTDCEPRKYLIIKKQTAWVLLYFFEFTE